jgi:pectate lyase
VIWRSLIVAVLLLAAGPATARPSAPLQGFGTDTPGGRDAPVVRVTTLADAGPGSLRAALAGGGQRTIFFDVGGTIELTDHLYVQGPFVTIDGGTAPPPGITLHGYGLVIRGNRGAHDVIVRRLRVRRAAIDGIQVAYGAARIVVDHVSVSGAGDGNIDITEDVRDVTVSWSILGRPAPPHKNMLIKYRSSRVTLHHNLFIAASQRNPLVSIDDEGTRAEDTTLDMRNNVVWDWNGGFGTMIRNHALANVVANLYGGPTGPSAHALVVCEEFCRGVAGTPGHAWVRDNVGVAPAALGSTAREAAPFRAPPVETQPACEAARAVLDDAGVRPLDAVDAGFVAEVRLQLTSCAGRPRD